MITEQAKKRCIAHSLQEQLEAHRRSLILAHLEDLTVEQQIDRIEDILDDKDKYGLAS